MLRFPIPLVALALVLIYLTTFVALPPPQEPNLRCLYGYEIGSECAELLLRGSELRPFTR